MNISANELVKLKNPDEVEKDQIFLVLEVNENRCLCEHVNCGMVLKPTYVFLLSDLVRCVDNGPLLTALINGDDVYYWFSIHKYKSGEFGRAELQKHQSGIFFFRTEHGFYYETEFTRTNYGFELMKY